ncbi:hypothetical protein J2810_002765 [Chryseobacterium rhizosphaerae]|uniref:hypothetical protein n=1 Tax=Chryseobacterium rhizosphaerae TaxID=395937 RepID=UPI00285B4D39|nr:hypothetical protein [Chryseobacterium rhizosphaerae]MDR6546705.1 hypothetical protein [Chryseobacterium rhizosphaerae]
MKRLLHIKLFTILFISSITSIKAQNNQFYNDAYQTIDNMLNDKQQYSFKEAVFSVENAYYQGKLDTDKLNQEVRFLKNFATAVMQDMNLKYTDSDRDKVAKYAAIYSIMCQALPVAVKDTVLQYKPFHYDFEDVFGHKDITNLFVSKLLATKKGNCNSLPYLYKILAEELGTTANLALAPNHVYIKHQIKSMGWFNTELTSGIFPQDSWLMASGYIHLDAIQNGVFMKALNDKESLALCLFDLAQAYNRNFPGNDGEFVLKAVNRAIEVYPNFAKALILRAETHKDRFTKLMDRHNLKTDNPENLKLVQQQDPEAKELFELMKKEYGHIYEIGYRQMPEEMYLDWLVSLRTEKDKYENKKLINNFTK